MKVDLLHGKLNKTYFTLLFSAIASTIVSTIYSTVDTICVGHYSGPDGAAALVCMNPLWALMFAFGFLAGVGGSVMMANQKGAGNENSANEYYTVSVVLSLIFSATLVIVYGIFMRPLLAFFGGEGEVLELAIEYMNAMLFSVPTFTLCACLATFMRNDGEALIPTIATIVGGVTNIVLDILLVFTFDLGAKGAGLATGIGQTIAFLIILSYFFTEKCSLKFTKPTKIPNILIKIVTVGFAAFSIDLTSGVIAAVHNIIIKNHLSTAHMAVYSTASILIIMFNCLFSGIGTAMQPIVATGFGAKDYQRIKDTLRLSFITALVMGVVFLGVCELFPEAILRIYMDVNDEVLDVGPRILQMYASAIPITGICMVCNYYFQSVLHRSSSIIISLSRGLVFPLIFLATIPMTLGYDAIWMATPFAEIVTCALAIVLIIPAIKSLNKNKLADLK